MKPYLMLVAVTLCYYANASCLLTKIPLEEKTRTAQIIAEGEVLQQKSVWSSDKSSIYTINTVKLNTPVKGNPSAIIEVITPGGEIDGKLLVVSPGASLDVGSQGVFFLIPSRTDLLQKSNYPRYELYGMAQGFMELDVNAGIYSDPFETYSNRTQLLQNISSYTPVNARFSNSSMANAAVSSGTINNFSPAIITAGTQSVLTITGNGFGSRTGAATIQFKDANSLSASAFKAIPDSSYIVSWTNTEIKVIVPGATTGQHGGAGSGLFKVIDANGAAITSATPITVTYNQFEYKKKKLSLVNVNSKGGYTFTLNNNVNGNVSAKSAFMRALTQWECATGVHVDIDNNTTSIGCSNQTDNINTISFASSSCPLPAGVLGITYSYYAVCSNAIAPDGIDMLFNPNVNFNFNTGNPASNQYDFESMVLHELGHAFGQGHHAHGDEVMYPSLTNGAVKRTLSSTSDIANINNILDRSEVATACGYSKHIRDYAGCSAVATTTPDAAFTADKNIGCAPLKVNFTNQTTGNATQWRWDVDNNGSTDYTTEHATHTFISPGIYNVKMTAINAAGKDSIVKFAHIVVAPSLNVSLEVAQHVSCYNGANGSLKVIPAGGSGLNLNFNWDNGQTGQVINNLKAGKYTVTLSDSYNCTASASADLQQPEDIQVEITYDNPRNGNNAILNVSGGTAPYTLQLNNGITLPANTPIGNLTVGNHPIIITDKNNCVKSTVVSIQNITTGLIDAERSFESLNIFPNPAKGQVNIHFSLKQYGTINLEMYTLSGQTTYQNVFENIKEQQAFIDLSGYSAGLYLLKISTPEGDTFRKIMVQ